jgi:hypothetical protein
MMSPAKTGFSVFGFVISLGLIFILVAVSLWAWNPLERIKQSRDGQRIANLDLIKNAIDETVSEETPLASTFGVPSSTVGVEVSTSPDGSGWVPMDLSGHFEELPDDPENGRTFEDILGSKVLGEYQFISDGKFYIIRTHLEAEISLERYAQDGSDNSWYEVGSAPGMSTYFGL